MHNFTSLHSLKLNHTKCGEFPKKICELSTLSDVSLAHNRLTNVPSDIQQLNELENFVCRDNKINEKRLSKELFNLPKLTVLDLSKNELCGLPDELELATNLLVLNVAFNEIENLSPQLFVELTNLTVLDLSNNKLSKFWHPILNYNHFYTFFLLLLVSLPAQLRRLSNLRVLKLSNNPLLHAQLRQIPALTKLEILHLRNTDRNAANFPTGLDSLVKLKELDISSNHLQTFPDAVNSLAALELLDVSDNELSELPSNISESLSRLETLNVSRNALTCLPVSVVRLSRLRRLYLNSNQISFDGLPAGIGKLSQLEIFSAADNKLKAIPESLCRCPNLRRLILNSNELVTLPVAIHLMELDVSSLFN